MQYLKKLLPFFYQTALLAVIAAPLLVYADDTFTPLTQLPGLTTAGNASTLPVFFNYLYKLCIGAAAVIAVLQIMRAGVMFMTNRGSASSNTAAKGLIQNSILGLVLVLSPYIVFSIINPNILKLDLDVSALKSNYQAIDTQALSPEGQKLICKDYTKTAFIDIGDGDAGRCAAVKGAGWAGTNCCATPTPTGNMCCGYSKNNDQSTKPVVDPDISQKGKFSFDYQYKDQNYDTGAACVVSGTQPFDTSETCNTRMNEAIATYTSGKKVYAISNNCNGIQGSWAPVTSYSATKNLEECPSE